MRKSYRFLTKDWTSLLFDRGLRRSPPGRTTGVPRTHTTHPRHLGLPRLRLGNDSHSQRSRNRHNLDRRYLIPGHVRSFFFSGWTLSVDSKFPFCLSSLVADIPKDRNCVRSSRSTARQTFQPVPSTYAQPYVVSSPSSANFSISTNQTLASFLPPPMTTSLTFRCPFLLPSRMPPGPSAPQS